MSVAEFLKPKEKKRKSRVDCSRYQSGSVDIPVVCCVCKAHWVITTNYPSLYTEAVKKRWSCAICGGKVEGPTEAEKVVKAPTGESTVTEDQIKTVVGRLPVPDGWKSLILQQTYIMGRSITALWSSIENVVNNKTRVKGLTDLHQRKEEMRAKCRKVFDEVVHG